MYSEQPTSEYRTRMMHESPQSLHPSVAPGNGNQGDRKQRYAHFAANLVMTPNSSTTGESILDDASISSVDYKADDAADDHDEVVILCELIGARNLRVHDEDQLKGIDSNSLRPYCVVKYDGSRIHKTKCAEDMGCNPIWVPSAKSHFLLRTTPRELSRSAMNISLYSREKSALPAGLLSSNNIFLGQVNLDSTTILNNCDEERRSYPIEDEIGEETSDLGKLALRFSIATPSDIRVVGMLNKNQKMNMDDSQRDVVDMVFDSTISAIKMPGNVFQKSTGRPLATLITEISDSEIAQTSFVNALSNVFTIRTKTDRETGIKKVRIKPKPDPDRESETKFMTHHDLKVETRLPSRQWVEAGSGSLGKLYVEVLSCHDLPNVDIGEAMGNVTDPFCALVYEDSCGMTDVIDDELSPHWLPWTQRAFVFNMIHPASILYLGVFDFDAIGNHDSIGRVAINVCNLQRDTIHTLKYNLYPSSNVTERSAAGCVTVRLRIEWFDARAALLGAVKLRPKMHVNVTKEKSFKVIRYTCFGEYDNEENFDMTVARSYVNEIFEYKAALGYLIGDTFRSLIFWHGQVELFSMMLPVHSFIFFVMATRLVERPQLIVPFSLLGIAWAMLANLTVRRQHPSPWNSCPSFMQYLHILRTGESAIPVRSVQEFEGAEAAKEYEMEWKKRLEEDRKIAEKRAALLQEIDNIGNDNIHTKISGGAIPLDLLLRLARYQGIVGRLCQKFRFIKILFTWEESVVSFWITASFLSAGLVALVLPWGFILTWTGRLIVWGMFGPHMKLVDLYLRANKKSDSALRSLMENFDIESKIARLRREDALKVKDIKEMAFGEYSVQVPSFNLCKFWKAVEQTLLKCVCVCVCLCAYVCMRSCVCVAETLLRMSLFLRAARHIDRPLPESSSRVCRKAPKPSNRSSRRLSVVELHKQDKYIPGQQLYGQMIPRPELDFEVHKEEAVLQESLLKMVQKRVRQIKDAEGLSEFERRELLKLGVVSNTPMSFGYEVVPLHSDNQPFDEEDECNGKTNAKMKKERSVRVAVKLMSDKNNYIGTRESDQVVLESNGDTTYCISDCVGGEEGLEIIGLGRYSTMTESMETSEYERLLLAESRESLIGAHNRSLSNVFICSGSTQVAFYRPLEPEHCQKSKDD